MVATGKLLDNHIGETTPAFLSQSSQLEDVPAKWRKIAAGD
jgi:hypothetical protein